MAMYRLGVDIGGTFTDFALLEEETGKMHVFKAPSTPERPEQSVFDGIVRICSNYDLEPEEIGYFVHGTTLAVNTVIQRSGSRAALLVTEGFRDILNIGRLRLPDVFNFFTETVQPLVPRSLVLEIAERCTAAGKIVRPVSPESVRDAVSKMKECNVEAVAVCLLHSYRNSDNEMAARAMIEKLAPELYVSVSSEIWPQMREYERALITVINAHIGKRMKRYFVDLQAGVHDCGLRAHVLSTKSNGGVMYAHEAGDRPVETLLSGPSAGVIGASFIGQQTGLGRLITFDMGGTSADVAVIDGEPRYSTENHVGDFPVIMPAVDVTSIGAGGGSIAWTDSSGVLKVGPMSAGAIPGPACYGLGGEAATVTDAYVCLGLIDPQRFLGGAVEIEPALAERAVDRLGRVLDLGRQEAAEAILRVATSQMYAGLVPLLARKGINYEDFALLCFGGAGPTHGFLLAREVGIRRVLVPLHPGVLCAAGSLAADLRRDFVRTLHTAMEQGAEAQVIARVGDGLRALTDDGRAWLDSHGLAFAATRIEWTADMRYLGQSFELNVPVTAEAVGDDSGRTLRTLFHRQYEQVYGYVDEVGDLEILDIRVTAIGVTPKPRLERIDSGEQARGVRPTAAERKIFIFGRVWQAAVSDRLSLPPGTSADGPLILEQYDTTVFVPPGFTVTVDGFGNLIGEARNAG